MNMFKGRISVNGSAAFEAPAGVTFSLNNAPTGSDGRPAIYGVRPEHFSLSEDGADAVVQVVEPTGSELQVVAKTWRQRNYRGVPRATSVQAG